MSDAPFPHVAPAFGAACLAYLQRHAIDPAVAAQCGVRDDRDALLYPYQTPDGQRYYRRRPVPGDRTFQPKGHPLCLWWPTGHPAAETAALLVCEGEPDALAALSAIPLPGPVGPLAVCAIPGTGFPVTRLAAEIDTIAPETVYLCFDADDAGGKYREHAASALHRHRVVAIELADGSDLADTLAEADDAGFLLSNLLLNFDAATPDGAAQPDAAAAMPVPGSVSAGDTHLTDLGNAQRLINNDGADLRYCHDFESWLVWTGKLWHRDRTGEIMRRAKQSVLDLYHQAADTADKDRRKALAQHAHRSESTVRLRALEQLARSDIRAAVTAEQLDSDPWALNVENGILDLRSGRLHPHERRELHTKIAPTIYDPDARSPEWERFLDDVTCGDHELQGFLQRAVGYTLTGQVSEEVLFFAYGPGGTGKSTFLEAIKRTLGSYATTADFSTFLQQRGGGPRNDIARLAGARLVASMEVDEDQRLAQALVKSITGGDTIAARFLYRESFEFTPQFKLWLAANDRPTVSERDEAMWRRLLCLPFVHVISDDRRDRGLKARLSDVLVHGPAILAWATAGALDWQRHGLAIPAAVHLATQDYREAMDPLADWIEERTTRGAAETALASELWTDYLAWSKDNNVSRPVNRRRFAERLTTEDGVAPARGTGGVRLYHGITLAHQRR